ncbi:MAG: hypothetical protein LBJ14_06515 [Desulfarculales bacterium]|nr:hypothetical protein [Desulfarculales bacterium]
MVTYNAMAKAAAQSGALEAASSGSKSGAITSKAEFGAAVVSKTLNLLNKNKSGKSSGVTPSYEMQKSVLDAGLTGKGLVISSKG